MSFISPICFYSNKQIGDVNGITKLRGTTKKAFKYVESMLPLFRDVVNKKTCIEAQQKEQKVRALFKAQS